MARDTGQKRELLVELLVEKIPKELLMHIPHRWWFVGDVLITTIPEELLEYRNDVGRAFLQLEPKRARTVLGKTGPTKGITREPNFEHLAGDKNTETVHKELGCLFKIDAAKLTFSPGNHFERKRMIDTVKKGEFIVDMFSCVGNLSLPIAVHKSPKKIIAAEINPYAFKYLEENIQLNKVSTVMKAIEGDNRVVLKNYEGKADRIISGYLHSDEDQIRQAVRLCNENSMFHYHIAITTKKEKQAEVMMDIKRLIELERRVCSRMIRKRVKKYSPGVEHIVLDIEIN
ncbi:MAG: class I SAM-dependent methyltransferase family protein [Candidatus Heimdallarchaeota archaeon]|nr:class I SAM-dependent methyltransferase family protein [Candidatus Heimdallarchaeota archaeon]MCK5182849.1 class I SAM-dependent methyltransferase family protein [Candidatus Heimdallarchaeota archaeon]MCK5298481.1 class I SAM-dependent methyltransferase family protein [Candidatus Heimdallarchaeota archaeon]